jgi:hypothetical protein
MADENASALVWAARSFEIILIGAPSLRGTLLRTAIESYPSVIPASTATADLTAAELGERAQLSGGAVRLEVEPCAGCRAKRIQGTKPGSRPILFRQRSLAGL